MAWSRSALGKGIHNGEDRPTRFSLLLTVLSLLDANQKPDRAITYSAVLHS
jgi:hypothetical protein